MPNAFRRSLQIESLERRDTPAVTVTYIPFAKAILIRGDAASDLVTIEQNDAANELTVTSSVAGSTADPVVRRYRGSNVDAISAFLGAGDDSLTYRLTSPEFTRTKFLRFDLGAGNDTANIDFAGRVDPVLPPPPPVEPNPPVDPLVEGEVTEGEEVQETVTPPPPVEPLPPDPAELRASLYLFLNADSGDDIVTARFGNLMSNGIINSRLMLGAGNDESTTTLFGNIASRSRMLVDVDGQSGNDQIRTVAQNRDIAANSFVDIYQRGGAGNDTIGLNYQGIVNGFFNSRMEGNLGDDILNSQTAIGAPSLGFITAMANGNEGNDQLIVGATWPAPSRGITPRIFVRADGGTGRDLGTITGLARGLSIEGAIPSDPVVPPPVVPTPVTPPPVPV